VFASDLHIGPTTDHRLLERAFALAADERPDLLVLGGDYIYVESTPERARRLRDLVASVPARSKVAVLGNHDLWAEHSLLEEALQEGGVQVLINDSVQLPAPHQRISVLGLDEPWTGNPDPEAALRACPADSLKILVSHSPDGFPMLERGIALYLAGHTHGGHIALPGGVPVVLPPGPGSRRWPRGFYDVGEGIAFVSKGLGGAEVPIRAFAPPEIVSFTLKARAGA
jgi:predicted MPP superfamily phosphohydrolase